MKKTILFLSFLLLLAGSAFGQTALTATTLSNAVTTSSITYITVASATGITVTPQTVLYIDNEALAVSSVSGTLIGVRRGMIGTAASGHISGAMVLAGPPAAFLSYDPSGSCTNGQGLFLYSPLVNVKRGNQWLCSTVTGKIVPGFGNIDFAPSQVTTAVASAAAKITPSGPLFHVTGTAAITGFNIPVGFDPKGSSQICLIPDAIFTTTAANNIALASTAVVSKSLCYVYDGNSAKFYPSY